MCAQSFHHVQLFAVLGAIASQAPLSLGFSSREYCSGLPFPPPEDLPNPGIKPTSLASLALAADSSPLSHLGSTTYYIKRGFPGGTAGKESTCNAGDLGSIPGLGRFPGGGKGYPLQ